MLSCSNCDASLKLNAKLCIKCGHVVTDEERESAVTGIPIKKPVVAPKAVVDEVLIPDPVIHKEVGRDDESTSEPVFSSELTETHILKPESVEKLDADTGPEIATSSEEKIENLKLADEVDSEPKVEVSIPSFPKSMPPQVKITTSTQEDKKKSANSPAQSSSKLIGLVLVGIVIIVTGGFLFIGGDKSSNMPVASSLPVEPKEAPVIAPPVAEPQPPVQAKVEAPAPPPPVQPAAVQPIQKPKSNNQQSDAPVAMPDLNKLVKDAINK